MYAEDSRSPSRNPLLDGGPAVWDELIEAVGPASMLLRIATRMGAGLRTSLTSEDIWQETLLHAWRDRAHCEWRGLQGFRRWLLQIAENRIRDASDRERTAKRGGAEATALQALSLRPHEDSSTGSAACLFQSTTPSRIAWHREQAELMRSALESLPELVREVVRLRLFEERSPDEIALELSISRAAVRHRLRQGSALYRERLTRSLALRASSFPPKG